ncbi:MAG: DUF6377 domain-containing protein [Prevotellaceae bacterium]|jgi:uncharacterized protein YoxC|nr:DUF6377 domain-containing protein [Prevotellaceae bacterium]
MKPFLIYIVLLWATTGASAKSEADSLLVQLDREIDNKPFYERQKEREIQDLKRMLDIPNLQPLQTYDIHYELLRKYQKYILDSAICYAEKNVIIAENLCHPTLIIEANLQLSLLCSFAGLYIESNRILQSIHRPSLPKELRPLYFETYSEFHGHYAQSNDQSLLENEQYRDSLLLDLDTASMQFKILLAVKLVHKWKIDDAEQQLLSLACQLSQGSADYALVTYLLGLVYEKQRKPELQKKYLALSALTDIRHAIKDHAALQNLALIHYASGDMDRAYKYMKSVIDDITFGNVRFRVIELSQYYAIINTSYLAKEIEQKTKLQLYLLLISALSLAVIIAGLYVYRQMRRLSKIKKELYETNRKLAELNKNTKFTNQQLQKVNVQLLEANQVKEEYIAHFFDICSSYIDKLEDYRKTLSKKATEHQVKDLFAMLKSTTLVDDERRKLYTYFDTLFLGLYPTFVEEFNALLVKEEHITPRPGELNTELRIFALIRLGITDSVKIAGFLRYSLKTVYNYRTKARTHAVVSRDDFEEMIMNIGRIQEKR